MTLTCKCGRKIPTRQSLSVSGKVPVRSECECGETLSATGGLAEETKGSRRRSRHERLMRMLRG